MTELQIKRVKVNANKAFTKKEYNTGFSILEQLDVLDFISFSEKKGWVSSGDSAKCFWNGWILNNTKYSYKLMDSPQAIPFLFNYYSKSKVFNKVFEKQLVSNHPEVFVEAIRKNKVFFKEERIDFLVEEIELPENLRIHQVVWEQFQSMELKLWKQIQNSLAILENHSINEILCYAVEYFEVNNFEADFDLSNQSNLADIYSFFMDMLLRNSNIKKEKQNSEDFIKKFDEIIYKYPKKKLKEVVFKCLNLIKHRQYIDTKFFQQYCYNPGFQPKYIYESLCFQETPESYYQWHVDGMRYQVCELGYNVKGKNLVDSCIVNRAIIKSEKKEDYLDNTILANNVNGLYQSLNDLGLTHFIFKDKTKVEVETIIRPIYTYSFNRYVRYYKKLKNIKNSGTEFADSWRKANDYLISLNRETLQLPYLYETKEEYFDLNVKADENFKIETANQIFDQFAYEIRDKNLFNRFKVRYSVIDRPFVIFDDNLFCPVLFFINFSNHFTYIKALLQNNQEKTADQIEDRLEDFLKVKGFNTFRPTKQEVDIIDGDSDLIVFDDENVLLIQLKRTNLRLNYEEQFKEYNNTDSKAANQLNKSEAYLKKNNSIFKIGNRKVEKWIVSNSFEKVKTLINGCLKINYLDIISILNNDEGLTFKTLSDLISFYESDGYFQIMAKEVVEIQKMFSHDNLDELLHPWSYFDENEAKKYNYYYKKGIGLNKKGKHNESIKVLNKCINLEKEDYQVYGAIANVYADIGQYKNALINFNKALNLSPDNPFILINYISVLAESGNYLEATITAEKFKSKYPILEHIYSNIIININLIRSYRL